jgi:hypothetical protein
MENAKERAQLDVECTAAEVEQEAAWCQAAMCDVLDGTAKKIRICTKSKKWWKANVRETRKVVRREKWRRPNLDEAARAQAEVQKLIQQSKWTMWSEHFQCLSGVEVCSTAHYVNPWAGMPMEASTDREGKQANTSVEKEEMPRHKFFPPNDNDQYY